MPTNRTDNYALSQWERSDRILMEDFNADNAKIDAALKAGADARTTLAGQVAKKAEVAAACEQAIYRGVSVTLTGGDVEHYSLTEHDQINLFGKQSQLAAGVTQLEYHADGLHISGRSLFPAAAKDPILAETKLFATDWGSAPRDKNRLLAQYHDGFLADMRRFL